MSKSFRLINLNFFLFKEVVIIGSNFDGIETCFKDYMHRVNLMYNLISK